MHGPALPRARFNPAIAFIFAQYLNELGALMYGGTLVLQEKFDAAAGVRRGPRAEGADRTMRLRRLWHGVICLGVLLGAGLAGVGGVSYAGPGSLRPALADARCVERNLVVPAAYRETTGSVTVPSPFSARCTVLPWPRASMSLFLISALMARSVAVRPSGPRMPPSGPP